MSFWTSMYYARPTQPPAITGDDLARFVTEFGALGVTSGRGPRRISVKFGDAIDQDDRPSEWVEWDEEMPTVGESVSIEWDIETHGCGSLNEIADRVRGRGERVYRAIVGLGGASEAIQHDLRVESSENACALRPHSWGLEIGVIAAGHMQSEDLLHVGWVALSLAGDGYSFPKPRRDVLLGAAQQSDVQRAMELCRRTWPVVPRPASVELIQGRREMGELWLYESVDEPLGWFWTMHETG